MHIGKRQTGFLPVCDWMITLKTASPYSLSEVSISLVNKQLAFTLAENILTRNQLINSLKSPVHLLLFLGLWYTRNPELLIE